MPLQARFVSIARAVRTLCLALGVAACSSVAAPSTAGPTTLPTASVLPVATATPPATTAPGSPSLDAPPAAALAAEGGDPVTGQLGSYAWRDSGSDSPWLPGAVIVVGAGEPLSVTLDPVVDVESWRARSVPSTADGPDGAALLGEGAGAPSFAAPPAGSWTVEVHVVFADGLGDAGYFWRLEVS